MGEVVETAAAVPSGVEVDPFFGQSAAPYAVERHWACGPRGPFQGSPAATGRFTGCVPVVVPSFRARLNGGVTANLFVPSALCGDLGWCAVGKGLVKPLDEHVVESSAATIHRDGHAAPLSSAREGHRRELSAVIRAVDFGPRLRQRHVECLDAEVGGERVGNRHDSTLRLSRSMTAVR